MISGYMCSYVETVAAFRPRVPGQSQKRLKQLQPQIKPLMKPFQCLRKKCFSMRNAVEAAVLIRVDPL